jgi:aspartate kinase
MGKTTDRLLAIASAAVGGERRDAIAQLKELHGYHLSESRQVVAASDREDLERMLDEHFLELQDLVRGLALLGELTPRSIDAISAYGERLSSRIVALALRRFGMSATHLDARKVIVTDRRHTAAVPLYRETYSKLATSIPPLAAAGVVVMGGFIGSTEDGVTSTLGRGGSDFTASIVGAGIGAKEIQIWTDVDGMLTADPTIFKDALRVKIISFEEAAELAYFGAKVLHPTTLSPAMEKNIPVLILNSQRPEAPGTRIVAQSVPCANIAKSIACKRNITLVNISSTRMLMAYGFLKRIFEVFDRFETAVDMISTSEVSVSLTVDNPSSLKSICQELRQFAEVTIEEGQAIVCVVGDNIRHTSGFAGRVFQALNGANIRMISQGASKRNLSLVVADVDLAKAVESLHRELFEKLDPEVFG